MDERVWIGLAEDIPVGWIGFESVEELRASTASATRIAVDDPAAALREIDFIGLFEHSPLARIERVVGPWRAGVGRTDPTWPRVTTLSGDHWSLEKCDEWSDCPLPLTADYEEIAAAQVAEPDGLEGITISVQISDRELRQLWEEILQAAGAEIVSPLDFAAVKLRDDFHRREYGAAETLVVHLTTAPWLVPQHADEVAFSTSDSPWSVLQHIGQRLKRGDREVE